MTAFDGLLSRPRKIGFGVGHLRRTKAQDARADPNPTDPGGTADRAVVMSFYPHGTSDAVRINPNGNATPGSASLSSTPWGKSWTAKPKPNAPAG